MLLIAFLLIILIIVAPVPVMISMRKRNSGRPHSLEDTFLRIPPP
jgi:hypothetical protein